MGTKKQRPRRPAQGKLLTDIIFSQSRESQTRALVGKPVARLDKSQSLAWFIAKGKKPPTRPLSRSEVRDEVRELPTEKMKARAKGRISRKYRDLIESGRELSALITVLEEKARTDGDTGACNALGRIAERALWGLVSVALKRPSVLVCLESLLVEIIETLRRIRIAILKDTDETKRNELTAREKQLWRLPTTERTRAAMVFRKKLPRRLFNWLMQVLPLVKARRKGGLNFEGEKIAFGDDWSKWPEPSEKEAEWYANKFIEEETKRQAGENLEDWKGFDFPKKCIKRHERKKLIVKNLRQILKRLSKRSADQSAPPA
ncbi:MAG TPA: hypothetical protein PLU30_15965 [Verrucomicrobiae bacterium]|nr:hypothetical protein [Verrucomicrobiae bacterium]